MTPVITAKRIDINGIVQGVGFRPYIFQLARHYHLTGRVANAETGVRLVIEGLSTDITAFEKALGQSPPPLARIVSIAAAETPVEGHSDFIIVPSEPADRRATLISPDVATCADCLQELRNPADRRFGYPFINCTNCGPRYTIINDIPYERSRTTMRAFTMCAACQAEYDNPEDRRFHAQPNACHVCGPQVILYDTQGRLLAEADPISAAVRLLRAGHILAIKGLGGFHLAVDALQDPAVERLRQRKMREEKPLAVMSADMETIATYAQVGEAEAQLLNDHRRPIVLLPKRLPEKLAFSVAPRNLYYGVMLPYTPLHHLIMDHGFTALVMTSGNRSEEPIAIDNDDAFARLGTIADFFLVHNRDINLRSDDSIVRRSAGQTRLLRRSRGYVPAPVFLHRSLPPVLACGAELKNTVCLTRDTQAFLSQHIGDLENAATESFFEQTIDHLQRILDIRPQAVACDDHPDYLSTLWAVRQPVRPIIQVQHHHAHVVAAIAEHQLEGPVLGLAFDGTGLGTDGTIWGGEVLLADAAGFRRLAHLQPVPMPGGGAAIKAPWRMGLAYLQDAFGQNCTHLELPFLATLDPAKVKIVLQMAAQNINAPATSSLGRLFDGVAAILGLRREVAFEGQAAMELEMIADGNIQAPYPFGWCSGPVGQIEVATIIRAVVVDILQGVPAFIISRRFHQTVIDLFADLCAQLAVETQLDRVVLSGGCFQNTLLLEGLSLALTQRRLKVYAHQQVPTNDGGLALGQAVVAGTRLAGISSEVTPS